MKEAPPSWLTKKQGKSMLDPEAANTFKGPTC